MRQGVGQQLALDVSTVDVRLVLCNICNGSYMTHKQQQIREHSLNR